MHPIQGGRKYILQHSITEGDGCLAMPRNRIRRVSFVHLLDYRDQYAHPDHPVLLRRLPPVNNLQVIRFT